MRASVVALGGAAVLLAAALGTRWLIAPQAAPGLDRSESVQVAAPDAPVTTPLAGQERDSDSADEVAEQVAAAEAPAALDAVSLPGFDATGVARDGLDEAEFEAVVARMRADPAALGALIEQARAETDPARLEVLLRMLGDVDDPAVIALASELVYSGDDAVRQQGLDLLKWVPPGNPDVLAVVSNLLSTESQAQVLVPALTVLSRPGGADDDARDTVVEQVAVLTDHADASVRRTSLDILARWSGDAAHTPRLLAGLSDPDDKVRGTAAFAFVDRPSDDPAVHRALFEVAADTDAPRVTRRGALLSLRSMPLEPQDMERVERLSRELDRR